MICTCTYTCNLQYLHFPLPFLFARCSSNFGSIFGPVFCLLVFHFGVHFGSKIGSKTVLFWFHFWNTFFSGLEAIQVPLESLPEPLILLLRASKTRKVWFSNSKITLFKMMHFGTLRFIMPSLESSWCILAHYDPKTELKTDPKMDPKWTQNETRICSIFGPIFK